MPQRDNPTSLDSAFARFTQELNAATTRSEVNELFQRSEEWILTLSARGQQQLFAAIQDHVASLDE